MANTREIGTVHRHGEERIMHNHELVRDHVNDLLHEGDVLRVERQLAAHRAVADGAAPAAAHTRFGVVRPARIRIGRWLVGIGWAVAGTGAGPATEAHAGGGAAGHAH
jgi:hypothetical protein